MSNIQNNPCGNVTVKCWDDYYQQAKCYQVKFFQPEQRKFIPKSLNAQGAFLPAITACRQQFYLPT